MTKTELLLSLTGCELKQSQFLFLKFEFIIVLFSEYMKNKIESFIIRYLQKNGDNDATSRNSNQSKTFS